MLSKTAEYALRAMVCLAGAPRRACSADYVAKKTQTPRRYLHRVLQDLVVAGLVRSRPGPGGGYELARATEETTILDIVNAVDPLQRIRHCPLGLAAHTELCPLHRELDKAYAATEAAFRGTTVKQLLEGADTADPLCDPTAEEKPSRRKRSK